MKTLTRKHAFDVAKREIAEWNVKLPRGLLMAILFCYIHRLIEGESVEETFFKKREPQIDFQI